MPAPRTQKKASAGAGRTASRRSASRAPSSRTPKRGTARRTPARTSRSRRSRSRLTVALIIATIVCAAWVIYPVLRIQYAQQREVHALEQELDDLKARNEELRAEVDALKTPEGIEALARDKLGLVKPGETAYVVTGGLAGDTTATALPAQSEGEPLWQEALDALFGFE